MTNTGYTPEEPICAPATPLVPSAIGIVRASGKNCIELASKFFSRKNALLEAKGNTLVYGWIKDGDEKIDEVMAGVYRSPKSFTGEDMIEIFCHGGINIVKSILDVFLKNGFRKAERGEFTFRAYINGKADLTKAEAVREIIESKTSVSRSRASGRLAGNLFSEIDAIKKLVIDSLAAIEVEIEYPEDEENISDTFDSSKLLEAEKKLSILKDSWKSEKLYQEGAKIVLCGKTNAGKSSLFNALLKEDRAIVSETEGTTRDWLESTADFDGIPVRLFDTAGIRETSDKIEEQGVQLAKDLSCEADVILYLIDSEKGLSDDDKSFIQSRTDIPLIKVYTKSDVYKKEAEENAVCVSAKTEEGIPLLIQKIKSVLEKGESVSRETAGLGSERQKESVSAALERIQHALHVAESAELGLDAVVQDLEDALDFLGEVTGSVTPDDILSSVFANFCVGK
ncbi:MAG: tRNA uridine-5-carboxymethylaminomethyl(34) synthesis GTPase MnmE [Treponema sp.]|nr:tRNA uridine-5-carboxymethylaminomethyl(34) synthesis GTPase MnmE [Treponema sp.]